jgi:hypothetical protein
VSTIGNVAPRGRHLADRMVAAPSAAQGYSLGLDCRWTGLLSGFRLGSWR